MLVYRIVSNKYANSLHASGFPGRWNKRGELVIYTAASAEIALLGNVAHRMGQGGFMRNESACMEIEIPDTSIQVIDKSDLPSDWSSASPYSQTNILGSSWYQKCAYLLLQVPSAPAPTGTSYLINTTHPLFREVQLTKSYPYPIDHRFAELDKDLTQYLKKS
ncbi:RES family NAD+ phosphorylase [Tunicatimonas pelagia]|uniref:RES family NAD+ phosphorylase n=1 Tax=Tunicatimonas pelagia TaxID=931531 RepID=UPI002665426B|nr:RES family NAD+ phosphorylase [Tunicatimonas pelagia]WKN46142.1 RES family NAD+ phosphorylase [Tunicatimonas pelagia]